MVDVCCKELPQEIFSDEDRLMDYRLELPQSIKFQKKLEEMMGKKLAKSLFNRRGLSRRTCTPVEKGA